jgi:prophage maintenance system killer protein
MAAFLAANGYRLEFNDAQAFAFLIGLYESGSFHFDKLDSWIRAHAAAE